MKTLYTLLVVLALASPVYAQDKPSNPVTITQEAQPLTDIEKLKIEKAALLGQIENLVKEVSQWRTMFAQAASSLGQYESKAQEAANKVYFGDLIKEIESTRPGFTFNPQDGSFKPKQ